MASEEGSRENRLAREVEGLQAEVRGLGQRCGMLGLLLGGQVGRRLKGGPPLAPSCC